MSLPVLMDGGSDERVLDFRSGMPADVVFTRASKGWYFDTTGTLVEAATNVPRFDYRPGRTNSHPWSNTPANWGLAAATVTANATANPLDEFITASALIASTANADHYTATNLAGFAAGGTITASIYVKQGTSLLHILRVYGIGNNHIACYLNFSTEVITAGGDLTGGGSVTSFGKTALANGWFRIWVTGIVDTTATTLLIRQHVVSGTGAGVFTGDGTSPSVYLYGATLEQSATLADLIPTTTTAVTLTVPLGLLREGQSTNSIRNSSAGGAVAGTPGTLPTNWYTSAGTGITRSVVGTGTESGIPYVDLRFAGTASGAAIISWGAEPFNAVAAATGQTWTANVFLRLMAGSFGTPSAPLQWNIQEYAGSTWLAQSGSAITPPSSAGLAAQRISFTRLLNQPTITTIWVNTFLEYASGSVVDFTVRIGAPQLEQNVLATSPILTTTASLTRATDVLYLNAPSGFIGGTQATNRLFPSVNWVTNATASGSVDGAVQNASTAPDGTTTAEKLIPGSFSSQHQWFRTWGGALSTSYVHSLYVKAAGLNYVSIELANTAFGTGQQVTVNLAAGTITTQSANSSGTIQALPNGWYRISVRATSLGTAGNYVANILPNASAGNPQPTTGNSTDGILVWGQQVEVGASATSYITTTTAPASAGSGGVSMCQEFGLLSNTAGLGAVFGFAGPGGFSDTIYGATSASQMNFTSILAAVGFGTSFGNLSAAGTLQRAAFSASPTRIDGAVNGVALTGTTHAGIPPAQTITFMTAPWGITEPKPSGHVRRVRMWPRALSAVELLQVTT